LMGVVFVVLHHLIAWPANIRQFQSHGAGRGWPGPRHRYWI